MDIINTSVRQGKGKIMQARRAARELALILFSQFDKNIAKYNQAEFEDIILKSVRTLTNNAIDELKVSVGAINAMKEYVDTYEAESSVNLSRPMQSNNIPVPLPMTSDLSGRLEELLNISKMYVKDEVEFCSLINARNGKCSQNCKYCAQSSHYNTEIDSFPLVGIDEVRKSAQDALKNKASRFAIVTSGKTPDESDFDAMLKMITEINKIEGLNSCASIGILNEEQAKRLKERLDPGILAVGVFVNERPEKIAELVNTGVIDLIQLHGEEDEEYVHKLKKMTDRPVIKAVQIKKENNARMPEFTADYYLLDSGKGSGQTLDWDSLPAIDSPWFLAGGISAENVQDAIENLHPYAVDFSSSVETDGCKDRDKILEIVRRIRDVER